MNWLEVSLTVDGELAEAVADVLARFAPNGVVTEQGIKFIDDEDHGTPTGPIVVRAYLEMDDHIEETRQKLEESLYYLGMIQPMPIPVYKQIADQNWMETWKQHYKPIPIGQRLIIVPVWLDSPEPGRIPIKIGQRSPAAVSPLARRWPLPFPGLPTNPFYGPLSTACFPGSMSSITPSFANPVR